MALETFPPLTLVSTRFLLSGALLLIVAWLSGMSMPRGREWLWTGLYGVVILGGGNGCLTYAELWIPSSLAALFVTVSPFWMVGIEAALPGGERLRWPVVRGMLVGFGGAALLVAPDIWGRGLQGDVWRGFLVLQLGSACWSFGSIGQRRLSKRANAIVSGAVQQLAAGLAFLPPALLIPEGPVNWSTRGVGALLYLVLFGSIVGYSAYIYALQRLPVALVSLHNYVNPVVAAILGWLVYREPFGQSESLALLIIFFGVALVKRHSPPPARPAN